MTENMGGDLHIWLNDVDSDRLHLETKNPGGAFREPVTPYLGWHASAMTPSEQESQCPPTIPRKS
jgi:hypothetical protein